MFSKKWDQGVFKPVLKPPVREKPMPDRKGRRGPEQQESDAVILEFSGYQPFGLGLSNQTLEYREIGVQDTPHATKESRVICCGSLGEQENGEAVLLPHQVHVVEQNAFQARPGRFP